MTESTSQMANGAIASIPNGDVDHAHDTQKTPNWYCGLIARKPVLMFVLTLLGNLSFIVITAILVNVGYDILPINFGKIPLDLETDEMFHRGEACRQRDNNSGIYPKIKTGSLVAERSSMAESVQLIFEGGNVFSQVNLKLIDGIERDITSTASYANYCLVEFFREYHNIAKARKRITSSFKQASANRLAQVYIIWGIDTLDKSHCHKTDMSCIGKTVWDDQFNLNPETSQTALLNLCEEIKRLPVEDERRLRIQRNAVTGLLEVNCFLENMNNYLQQEANSSSYAAATNLSLPATNITIDKLMAAHPDLYNMSQVSSSFHRYFEAGTFHWLTNGYASQLSQDFIQFVNLLGDTGDGQDTIPISNRTGYYIGTRLRYAAITVNTTLQFGNLGYVEGLPIVDAWEEFFKAKVLASSAVQGVVIGICLAFFILVLATQNIIVGFLATLTIGCIVVSVIGVIPTAGWKLGVLESLNLSLVVGLAVDYVVHLAEGYHLSKKSDRLGRVHDMLQEVGISVLSGAITTLGASFFMLFALILFFFQFGIFMFCTICFSAFYALFSTLLALIGPENNFGSIRPLFTAIKKCFTKKNVVQISHTDKVGQNGENMTNHVIITDL